MTIDNGEGEGVANEAIRLISRIAELNRPASADGSILFPNGIQSIHLRLELTKLGSVELDINQPPPKTEPEESRQGVARTVRSRSFPPFLALADLPCSPADATAAIILQTCDDVWPGTNTDCNLFVKAAVKPFFGDLFSTLDADGIVGFLSDLSNGWTNTTSIPQAIASAQGGQFVIAGMTSTQLGQDHGHLAVVCACDGQMSGDVVVPLGYAGSIGAASTRIRGARLSGSFPADDVRTEQVTYFSKVCPSGTSS